ncbi:MAG: helix-turn-helix domain-containing protein [Thiohalospira sp.]
MEGELRNPDFHARLRQLVGKERPYSWAARVGISKGAFTRIWREGTIPSPELLLRIREHAGVSLDWLLTGDGVGPGEAAMDTELLARTLERVEGVLAESGEVMPPERKAQRVAALYALGLERGQPPEPDAVRRLVP